MAGRSNTRSSAGTPSGEPSRGGGDGRPPGRRHDADDTVAALAKPLERILARLPATQRRVLELRMGLADGHPHSLSDTARELGIGMTEAREIEARAFEHIREVIPLDQLGKLLKS